MEGMTGIIGMTEITGITRMTVITKRREVNPLFQEYTDEIKCSTIAKFEGQAAE